MFPSSDSLPGAMPGPAPDPNAEAAVSGIGPGLQSLPMSPDQVAEWWERIEAARARQKVHEATWDTLLKEYLPKVVGYDQPEAIKVNAHFRNVHTKLPKLFFQVPDLILTPNGPLKDPIIDPVTGMPVLSPETMLPMTAEDVAVVKQEVLRKKLGREPEGINAPRLIDELLFDVLAWTGIAGSKIGYRAVIQTVQQPVLDPITGMPQMDMATGQPVLQPVPVVIWEEWYWTRIGPKKLLLPDELKSTRFDQDSPWIGMEFALTEDEARRAFGITGEMQFSQEDDRTFKHADDQGSRGKKLIRGVEIWLKASKYDPAVLNPLQIRQLVLLDGNREAPALYRDDPDQTFDEMGKITPDSRIGFPIHVLTIRDLAESCYPPSDSAFTNSQAKHLNTHRQQSSKLRDANIGRFFYDETAFSKEEIVSITSSDVGSWHGVASGRLREGVEKVVAQVTQANQSRDDYRLSAIIKDDMDETLGLPRSEAGMPETGETTATEVATSSSKAAERLEKERGRVLDFFLAGVRKFDSLLQRYADDADYVQIVGQDGTRRLQAWNRQVIAGGYAYDAKPDSQLRIDAARDRAQLMAFYQQTIADPMINRLPIVKKLAQYFGLDPNQVVMPVMMPTGVPTASGEIDGSGGPPSSGGGGSSSGGKAPTGALENRPVPGAGTTQVQNKLQGR